MVLKSLMKNPMLMIGFLFLAIFLFQLRDQGYFDQRSAKLIPTSCKAVKVRLDKYLHDSWEISCNENNLEVIVPIEESVIENMEKTFPKEELRTKDHKPFKLGLQKTLFTVMANSYISVAKYSPEDSLSRTDIISLRVIHPILTLNSISEGKHVVNLKTIKNFKRVTKHLESTVQVQEVFK